MENEEHEVERTSFQTWVMVWRKIFMIIAHCIFSLLLLPIISVLLILGLITFGITWKWIKPALSFCNGLLDFIGGGY